ncbi:MAG TPA: prephenate dehydratase [Candidatus Methanomethylophilaceae archaeon]|nr:prephenate dehydratase [Candidatus Methanomethylophilaceae archaeon]
MEKPSMKELGQIDRQLAELMSERAKVFLRSVIELSPDHIISYEEDILKQLEEIDLQPLDEQIVSRILRELFSASRSLLGPETVSYLGPEASFTHQAAFRRFGPSAKLIPCDSISAVFRSVISEESAYGVVPVENSTEGAVTYTLDLLVNSDVQISAEANLRISHCLMSADGREDFSVVYSHPQVFAQCREWISKNLPDVELKELKSTAEAAKRARDDGAAAIASRLASELYGLKIIRAGIEDNPDNSTRFLVLSKRNPPPTGDDKTSICFALRDRPGALYDALHPFKEKGTNLTMIQSRPSKVRNWDYVFFADMEGHRCDKNVADALRELQESCIFLRILGSYPRNDSVQ